MIGMYVFLMSLHAFLAGLNVGMRNGWAAAINGFTALVWTIVLLRSFK